MTQGSRDPFAPTPLRSRQIDITTRIGALRPTTPTGLQSLDRLIGGLRTGTLTTLSGPPGVGKTALALFWSYMAARSGAATLYASVSLDETEVMARLASRALHREHPNVTSPYGTIWSGEAWQRAETRGPVGKALDTVVDKVGEHLFLHAAAPSDPIGHLRERVARLWGRYERVVLVVDDLDSFALEGSSDAAGRVMYVAHALREMADQGCAVLATGLTETIFPAGAAATIGLSLADPPEPIGLPANAPSALGVSALDLHVYKNRLGPTGIIPLWFVAGAAIFQERG